jgi:G3E family GTPase
MKILVISGFLGAGKTTFIKELVKRTGKQIVVLENEYGETNLDSREIAGESKINIWELTEGCVCCTMKESFATSILTISASLDPEYLVVEPTGIGKLGAILHNIKKVSYEKIRLLKPVVILPPRSYFSHMEEYRDIYLDQLKNAGVIAFSKCENEDSAVIEQVTKAIAEQNPDAQITPTHYSQMPDEWWNSLLESENNRKIKMSVSMRTPPQEITVKQGGLHNIGELVVFLEDILHGTLGGITRAKGILPVGKDWIRFDLADKLYSVRGETLETPSTECVFIGYQIEEEKLHKRLNLPLSYKL